MDVAYDHTFQDEVTSSTTQVKGTETDGSKQSLNDEFQQVYKVISTSPWAARFGTFVGNVRKQGESVYESSKKEYGPMAEQATKGLNNFGSSLVNHTRGISISQITTRITPQKLEDSALSVGADSSVARSNREIFLLKIKKGAAERLSQIEAAEAMADEYIARFGSNIGSFLRDAITIAPPNVDADGDRRATGSEFKESDKGGKHIFTTRLDAQLHLLHTNIELLRTDPAVPRYIDFAREFSIGERTENISYDLEHYPELRVVMETLVPANIQYAQFWTRYYFLRDELNLEEKRRRDLLKGASVDQEEVNWDEDDEDEEDQSSEEEDPGHLTKKSIDIIGSASALRPRPARVNKPVSTDKTSLPDSESSYDVVSSGSSKAPSQGTENSSKKKTQTSEDNESSDDDTSEEDWE